MLFSGNYAILIASTIPEVMQRCDKIVVLKNGSIADMGTYNELLSRSTLPNS